MTLPEVAIELLDATAAQTAIPELTEILRDCVANGASVGFMDWNTPADYAAFWSGVAAEVAAGRTILFVARDGDEILGTAQLQLIGKPNQPLGEALMQAAETAARQAKRDLLVLDTDENGAARRLYARLGWTEIGTIPRYALMPDGRDCGSTFFYKSLA
mgnify:CR=1 FL=1